MGAVTVLEGIRVLELAHMVAGPTCGSILADLGADVTKVELPPGGDLTRNFGPRLAGGTSALFAGVNRSKRGLLADLADPVDRDAVAALLADADVFVTNFDAARLAAAGLDAASCSAAHPRLVYLRISAFGPGGPPGTDSLAQAATGMTTVTGSPGSGGVRAGPPVVDVATGVWAALAALAALEQRRRTGRGQVVDLSLADVSLHLQHSHLAMYARDAASVTPLGNHSPIVCTPVFRTTTARLFVSLVTDRHWRAFRELVGAADLTTDPRFATNALRQTNQAALEARLGPDFAGRPAAQWSDLLTGLGIPNAVERGYAEVLADPAHRADGTLFDLDSTGGETSLQVALPVRFSSASPRPPSFAPSLTRHAN